MSYCRWSSMDYTCDLYVYEDAYNGYTTHVASRRRDWGPDGPPPSPYDMNGFALIEAGKTEEWITLKDAYHTALDAVEMAPIGGPHDGESFRDDALEDLRDRLLDLRAKGYRFPDEVLATIDEEIAERDSA